MHVNGWGDKESIASSLYAVRIYGSWRQVQAQFLAALAFLLPPPPSLSILSMVRPAGHTRHTQFTIMSASRYTADIQPNMMKKALVRLFGLFVLVQFEGVITARSKSFCAVFFLQPHTFPSQHPQTHRSTTPWAKHPNSCRSATTEDATMTQTTTRKRTSTELR